MAKITKIVQQETIVAIASAVVPSQGSIGVVRLSGQTALEIAKRIFHPQGKNNGNPTAFFMVISNILTITPSLMKHCCYPCSLPVLTQGKM